MLDSGCNILTEQVQAGKISKVYTLSSHRGETNAPQSQETLTGEGNGCGSRKEGVGWSGPALKVQPCPPYHFTFTERGGPGELTVG